MSVNRIVLLLVLGSGLALAACATTPAVQEAATAAQEPTLRFSQIEFQYLTAVTTIIGENLQYPYRAFKAGESGVAVVQVQVARDGSIMEAKLVRKSGSTSIDTEAVNLFDRIHRFPSVPTELFPGADKFAFTVPINYDRTGTATSTGLQLQDGAPTFTSPTWR